MSSKTKGSKKLTLKIDPNDVGFSVNYVKTYFMNALKYEKTAVTILNALEENNWKNNIFEGSMKLLDNVLSLEIRKRNIHCELLTKYIKKLEMLEGRFKAYIQSKHFRLVSKVMEYCSEFLAMSEKAIKSKKAIDALKKEKQGKSAFADHVNRAKQVLLDLEEIRSQIDSSKIAEIEEGFTNFNKFPNTLSKIIMRYFERALEIRKKISSDMRDLIKEYVENEGVKIDVNIFRTIKSIVIQIQNPDKDNLEEDEIFESLYGMEGAVEEAVEDWNSENPDEMERTITTSRRSAKSRARQKEEEDDDEDCSVDYVLQKKGTTKGKHSEQNMDEYSGLDPFSGDLLDGDDDFGSAFDFMEDDGPSLRPKPSTRLSKRDNMGSNSSLFSEF